MAGSLNRAELIGNLGSDPEVRTTNNGSKVVTLSVATSESWKDKSTGEKVEKTEWHRVVIFGGVDSDGLAGVAEQYLKKGSKVYVEGQIKTRKWQDQSGQDRYSTEIVLSGRNAGLILLSGQGNGHTRSEDDYGQTKTARPQARQESQPALDDDDIPF